MKERIIHHLEIPNKNEHVSIRAYELTDKLIAEKYKHEVNKQLEVSKERTKDSNGNEVTSEVHDHNEENEIESAGVSFTDLIPLPGPSGIQTAKKQQCINRKQHSEIFTSTPQKTTLDEKAERKLQNKMKKDAKTKGTKRKLADEDEPNETQTTTTIRKNPERTCKEALALTSDNIPEDEDEYDDD
ncbi:unnamed protein product [Phaedon cochleariae]|uniref:Uncharacterized protein n=1 Tax=Phaedon cochleariae TaxID=80249 RepID=A0A9N9X3G6_PHACE|nr:unnamed protein product [Phaedon cochleariae]